MKILIGKYTIERLDEYNISLSKEYTNKKGKLAKQNIGYYSNLTSCLVSLHFHLVEDGEDITSVEQYINDLEEINELIVGSVEKLVENVGEVI